MPMCNYKPLILLLANTIVGLLLRAYEEGNPGSIHPEGNPGSIHPSIHPSNHPSEVGQWSFKEE